MKVVVVGDVHDLWDPDDEAAVQSMGADIVLFVGDFGNENVELVTRIARCNVPKAIILGNHDSWNHRDSRWSGDAWSQFLANPNDSLQQQLNILGSDHVGWRSKIVPGKSAAVVGCRPFTWGGPLYHTTLYLWQAMGAPTFKDSTRKILAAAQQVPADHLLLLLGHNGPTGLGARGADICGCDFKPGEGDYGDPDMREALDELARQGRRVPLVAFGHMHARLQNGGQRRRALLDLNNGTLFLNAAVVPRLLRANVRDGERGQEVPVKLHHFCVVDIVNGAVVAAQDVYVRRLPGGSFTVHASTDLLAMAQAR